MDADDHNTEKVMPVKIYRVNDFSTWVYLSGNKKAVHITYEQLFMQPNQIV